MNGVECVRSMQHTLTGAERVFRAVVTDGCAAHVRINQFPETVPLSGKDISLFKVEIVQTVKRTDLHDLFWMIRLIDHKETPPSCYHFTTCAAMGKERFDKIKLILTDGLVCK